MSKVIVDLDSIVFDILTPWIEWWNSNNPTDPLDTSKIDSWDMHLGLASKSKKIYDVLEIEGFFRNLKPLPGAIEAIEHLNKNSELIIFTAADPPISYKEKVESVRENLPFLSKRQLIIGHEKHWFPADFFIDDSPNNATKYRQANPNSKILTIEYPYNKNCTAYDYIASDYKDTRTAWGLILAKFAIWSNNA